MTKHIHSTASKPSVLKQASNHIPGHALGKVVRKHRAGDLARGSRDVTWVIRCKEGTVYEVREQRAASGAVHEDEVVTLSNGTRCRRIRATVGVDGEDQDMVFLSNHEAWAASTIVDLCRARWEIEVFLKQIKQTPKRCDFIRYSANGIRWQIGVALLVHLMLRYLAWAGQWGQSFVRMFALVRGVIGRRLDIWALLDRHGTGKGSDKNLANPPPFLGHDPREDGGSCGTLRAAR